MENRKIKELCRAFEGIAPASLATATYANTPWVLFKDFRRFLVIANCAAMANGSSLTVSLQQATTIGGGGPAKALAGYGNGVFTASSWPGGTQAGGAAAEAVEMHLDTANGFRYVRGRIIQDSGGAIVCSAIVLKCEYIYSPPTWPVTQAIVEPVTSTTTVTTAAP